MKTTRDNDGLATGVAVGMIVLYAGMLAMGEVQHLWILDAQGHPVVNDFAVFFSVGRLILSSGASAAYDAHLERAAELATIGHPYTQLLGWSYPPAFLFVVALLARLPYVTGFLVWCISTLAFQAGAVAAIARRPQAFVWALAMPWVPEVLIVGQNGLLTAALVGVALLALERRPAIAGLAIGLLTYKPQFGILIPVALIAGGYRRAFLWAAASALAVNVAAGAVFGFNTFAAFLHAMSGAAGSHLLRSELGWNKLQSLYGVMRYVGASAVLAWTAQLLLSIAAALSVAICWHSPRVSHHLKAATLAAAIPLVTPYILYYDVPMVAIAVAFLSRDRPIDRFEFATLAFCTICLFGPLFSSIPSAFPAILFTNLLVLRRLLPTFAAELRTGCWPHLLDVDREPAGRRPATLSREVSSS